MIIYIDTSALGRVYLGDQDDSATLADVLYGGGDPAVTSELTDAEIASTIARAQRDEAIDAADAENLLARYAADTSDSGPLGMIPLDSDTLSLARKYVRATAVRTLDAIHLAACSRFAEAVADTVQLLSRDNRQNDAARTLGLGVFEN